MYLRRANEMNSKKYFAAEGKPLPAGQPLVAAVFLLGGRVL
jgi:hypothetical protein